MFGIDTFIPKTVTKSTLDFVFTIRKFGLQVCKPCAGSG